MQPSSNADITNFPAHQSLGEIVAHLHTLYPKLIDLSLNRIERLLKDLGNPHENLPPYIHVAGTNGKGSTIATLRSIMEIHGYSVHVMTSPHLIKLNERIRVAGELIDDRTLIEILQECMEVNGNNPITFFEMMTAASFLIFSRVPADFCLIETGLGGLYDSTNVVRSPLLSIITSISYDHMEFLGKNLKTIANEKAGIIKSECPCVLAKQSEQALEENVPNIIASKASALRSKLYNHESDWDIEQTLPDQEKGTITFRYQGEEYALKAPNLLGPHQIDNIGAALAAWRIIEDKPLDSQLVSQALMRISWPGRLQRLERGKLQGLLQQNTELWVDGGHNISAAKALSKQMAHWEKTDSKNLHIVIGMMHNKDADAYLEIVSPYASSISCVPIPEEKNAYSAKDLQNIAKTHHTKTHVCLSAHNALDNIAQQANAEPSRIIILGSLYLIGKILEENGNHGIV